MCEVCRAEEAGEDRAFAGGAWWYRVGPGRWYREGSAARMAAGRAMFLAQSQRIAAWLEGYPYGARGAGGPPEKRR